MGAPWFAGPMLGLDFETTGVDEENDRIVTAALAQIGPGGATPQLWVVNQGIEIPEAAARIHGWTTERVQAEGGESEEIFTTIASRLATSMHSGVPIVGMNLAYDFTIFDRELRRHRLRTLLSYRKGSRKLADMAAHYGVALGDGAHDAVADVLAAARIAYKIGRQYEQVGAMSLDELHDAQIGWRAEQQASLESYFRRQGRDETCDGSWPLREFAEQVTS